MMNPTLENLLLYEVFWKEMQPVLGFCKHMVKNIQSSEQKFIQALKGLTLLTILVLQIEQVLEAQ